MGVVFIFVRWFNNLFFMESQRYNLKFCQMVEVAFLALSREVSIVLGIV